MHTHTHTHNSPQNLLTNVDVSDISHWLEASARPPARNWSERYLWSTHARRYTNTPTHPCPPYLTPALSLWSTYLPPCYACRSTCTHTVPYSCREAKQLRGHRWHVGPFGDSPHAQEPLVERVERAFSVDFALYWSSVRDLPKWGHVPIQVA